MIGQATVICASAGEQGALGEMQAHARERGVSQADDALPFCTHQAQARQPTGRDGQEFFSAFQTSSLAASKCPPHRSIAASNTSRLGIQHPRRVATSAEGQLHFMDALERAPRASLPFRTSITHSTSTLLGQHTHHQAAPNVRTTHITSTTHQHN